MRVMSVKRVLVVLSVVGVVVDCWSDEAAAAAAADDEQAFPAAVCG